MSWKVRHEGSPHARTGLTLAQVAEGLRDGQWETTDEVMGPQDSSWVAVADHPQLEELAAELEERPRNEEDETRLDMNALIDVCLVLLIFFMLTTTYAVAVQKVVPLPSPEEERQGKSGAKPIKMDQVKRHMVWVEALADKAGKVTVRIDKLTAPVVRADGKTLDTDKFRDALSKYTRGEDRKTEILLDARDVSWGLVIAIQDAAKAAGVRTVNLAQPPKK